MPVFVTACNVVYRRLARPVLLRLDPERAHAWAAACLEALQRQPALAEALRSALTYRSPRLALRLWGRDFVHPLGLAAGFDKDARFPHGAAALGFAFVEVGTVTPRPQPGNPPPRLFRLAAHEALINRMGFNNEGVAALVARLARARPLPVPVGVNIGKNRDTPLERAADDYLTAFAAVAPLADYVVVNISSPNTPGLRGLQEGRALVELLDGLAAVRRAHAAAGPTPPLLVKVAPDLSAAELQALAEAALAAGVDGFVATNTTVARPGLTGPPAHEPGGLSGRPLAPMALRTTAALYRLTGGRVPIVGVGGIFSAQDAYRRIRAGATLLQVYTALIYRGPGLVRELTEGLDRLLRRDGFGHVREAVGVDAARLAEGGDGP